MWFIPLVKKIWTPISIIASITCIIACQVSLIKRKATTILQNSSHLKQSIKFGIFYQSTLVQWAKAQFSTLLYHFWKKRNLELWKLAWKILSRKTFRYFWQIFSIKSLTMICAFPNPFQSLVQGLSLWLNLFLKKWSVKWMIINQWKSLNCFRKYSPKFLSVRQILITVSFLINIQINIRINKAAKWKRWLKGLENILEIWVSKKCLFRHLLC